MKPYDRPQTSLKDRQHRASRSFRSNKKARSSHRRADWLFFVKPLGLALTLLIGSLEVFAESIKLAYAALSETQVAAWMAKEGGYLSKYGTTAISFLMTLASACPARAAETLDQIVTGAKKEGEIVFVAGSETFGGRKGFAELETAFNKKIGTNARISFSAGPELNATAARVITESKAGKASSDFYLGSQSHFALFHQQAASAGRGDGRLSQGGRWRRAAIQGGIGVGTEAVIYGFM